ncbi:galactitol-1-phosphate 5-dehydrogenase [Enemella sp. A6]|uniref:galactitol-1-phosphate 5-dehydrogenase n=1 Tax=Enemella sp. A6 TaxID=3440152 RepID=UPI003EC00CCB
MSDNLMTAVAVTGKEQFTIAETGLPAVGPTDVLVKVAYCGVCGSDIPRYFDGAVHQFPQVLGHEFSGIVETVGADVNTVRPGDRVAVAPLVPCHDCTQCDTGHPSLCGHYSFIGSRQQGALAEYVAAPARNVVPVGDLSLRSAALIEPLTVAIHGVDRARDVTGRDAVVLGGGVIGLMTLITLRARGARTISVVDINPWVLQMAEKFGATHTVNSLEVDPVEHCARIGAPHLTVETAGAVVTRQQALRLAGRAGEIVLVGTPTAELGLSVADYEQILRKELSIHGSWMSYSAPFPGPEWAEAIDLLRTSEHDPEALITHEFALDQAAEGFQVLRDPQAHRLKVMFRAGGETS